MVLVFLCHHYDSLITLNVVVCSSVCGVDLTSGDRCFVMGGRVQAIFYLPRFGILGCYTVTWSFFIFTVITLFIRQNGVMTD